VSGRSAKTAHNKGVDALSEINTTLLCAVLRLLGKGNELWDGSDSRDCLHTY